MSKMEIEHTLVFGLIGSLAVNYLLGCVIPLPTHVSLAILAVLATRYRRRLYVVMRTLPRDLRFVYCLLKFMSITKKLQRNNMSVCKVFTKKIKENPDKVLLRFVDQDWTGKDIEEYSNRIANTFKEAGYKKGDVVALFMGNCPEYVCIWLGLSKLGVVTALINYNLRNQPLVHSITVSDCKAIIFGGDLAQAVKEVQDSLTESLKKFQLGGTPEADTQDLGELTRNALPSPPDVTYPGYSDKLLYIYTSGTTGLPKAANVPNSRYMFAILAAVCFNFRKDDVIYNPLPLYHTAGGILGIGAAIVANCTVVIKPKFSASSYFPDCIKYNCTVAQYIGEMCRYVMAVPPRPEDTQHRIRVMLGNGMRPSIWQKFVDRFHIPNVVELYGATEGNANIVNIDNTVGAVGFLPQSLPQAVYPVAIVRTNLETGEVIRNEQGLCDRCAINEPGMFIGLISDKDATRAYHGYVDKEASKKKVLENVFVKGDKYFLTGDILVMDELGYIYFKDRTGDTYRWKGENVASDEVATAICAVLNRGDVAVYGVEVPGSEGRAGMVAVEDPDNSLDLDTLARGLDKALPSYARPIFIRKVAQLEKTGTYKIKKVDLQKEGINPNMIKDPIFFRSGSSYKPFTAKEYEDITSGKISL